MSARERLTAAFRKAGALFVGFYGEVVITSWPTAALADKCADTMRRVGLVGIERHMDGSETEYVCRGVIE